MQWTTVILKDELALSTSFKDDMATISTGFPSGTDNFFSLNTDDLFSLHWPIEQQRIQPCPIYSQTAWVGENESFKVKEDDKAQLCEEI
jgi:hypothetical protein